MFACTSLLNDSVAVDLEQMRDKGNLKLHINHLCHETCSNIRGLEGDNGVKHTYSD